MMSDIDGNTDTDTDIPSTSTPMTIGDLQTSPRKRGRESSANHGQWRDEDSATMENFSIPGGNT
jgi:hypothetical protein